MSEIEQIMENQQQPQHVVPDAVAENALFGKYELGKLLGCGAFAKVYHARNVGTGLSVAIKIINKKRLSGTNLMFNIKREITIMSRLRHPNIVKLYEVLASKSKIYFVIEFVKGGELFAKVSKARFSEDLSRKYFQQLISAISYCHLRGIFHRDLKPENLLIDESGDLKVTDFGLSALTDQVRTDGLLHTLCGTPAYVAPEILTKKGYDGAKIDVWSCGVILFVLNAGYLPFNDPNLMVMYRKIYKGDFRCPKWFSPELRRFLYRLLDTNPLTRITIDENLKDPWFKKGGLRALSVTEDDYFDNMEEKDEESMKGVKGLNAFDLISFSPSLDLSGLFDNSFNSVDDSERLVFLEAPEKIMNGIEEFAKVEKLRVKKKKEFGVELQCKNGSLVIGVEVYRLTDNLVVVEAKRKGGDAGFYNQVWKNKLKAFLSQVITSASISTSASTSTSASASTSQVSIN